MFYNRCLFFIFFISPQDLQAPLADCCETLSRDQYLAEFYNASPKIRGVPLKNLGAKHAKFGSILHNFRLWSWIFPEQNKISKIGKTCDRERFLSCLAKYVWWTLVHYPENRTCEFGPTQIDFFRTLYFGPLGHWPLKFLHALDTGHGLHASAHCQLGQWSPK